MLLPFRFSCDHVIHPGAVRVIMTLLPSVFSPEDPQVQKCKQSLFFTALYIILHVAFFPFSPQLSVEVQFSLAHHIQAMVKTERNRQVLCSGGFVSTLLNHYQCILLDPDHMLHLPVTRILEKLTSQAISHKELR